MNIWFCETCGKRVTEKDLAQNQAFDKQVKGMYCKDCAVGVNTMAFEPIQAPPSGSTIPTATAVAPVSSATAKLPTSAATPMTPTTRIIERPSGKNLRPASAMTTARAKVPAKSASKPADKRDGSMIYVAIGVGAVLLIGGLIYAMRSPNPTPTETASDAPAKPSNDPSKSGGDSSAKPKPISSSQSTTPSTRTNPVGPGPLNGERTGGEPVDLAKKADQAFEKLKAELAALPADEKDKRIALLEAFNKEFGETMLGSRARAMLSEIKNPAPANPQVQVAPVPPGPDGQAAQGGLPKGNPLESPFNGKDLSNWRYRVPESAKEATVENGQILLSADFNGHIETDFKYKSFVLECEIFIEDSGGGYLEVQTGAGNIMLDRNCSGAWLTLQLAFKNGSGTIRMTGSDRGKPAFNQVGLTDTIRFFTYKGGKKIIRAIRVFEYPDK